MQRHPLQYSMPADGHIQIADIKDCGARATGGVRRTAHVGMTNTGIAYTGMTSIGNTARTSRRGRLSNNRCV